MSIRMMILFISLLGFFYLPNMAVAGTYDNAITFWNQYGNNGTQNGNYFYFCTKGSTAQGGVKYKTIGYSVTVKVGSTNLTTAQFKLLSSYDLDTRESGGDTYILWRIPVTKVQSRLQLANDEKVLYQLYTEIQKYTFDSIMTVTENGTAKGSIDESGNGKVGTSGEVYTTLSGIKGARTWSNPNDLNNYYDKKIDVSPVNPLSVNRISITGNNAYYKGIVSGDATYYIKPSTTADLSFTAGSDFTSVNFKPNANLFHVTGYGNNECVDVRTHMNNNNCIFWKDAGVINVKSASSSRSGGSLTATITGPLDVPNEKMINVYPQAKVFLSNSITANDNRRSDTYIACDTAKYDPSKRVVVIGDGAAPTITVNGTTVTAWDGGSGVRSITVLNMDGGVYSMHYGNSCSVPTGKYMVYAEDNVGNQSNRISMSNTADVKLSVTNNGSWNPSNVQINGTTSSGKIGAIVVWCPIIGQDENSEGALYYSLNGSNVNISVDATRFYTNFDGGYQLHAKTVVFNGMGSYLGEDEISFWVNMDFTPPAIGWGKANESEIKWGKPGQTYAFSSTSCDYNRFSAYGTAYASGIQTLTMSNANTGEILAYGNYDAGTQQYFASMDVTQEVRVKMEAFDAAGNKNMGYTTIRFDGVSPTVTMSISEEKGILNKETGWRNGDVTVRTLYEDNQSGIRESAWQYSNSLNGNYYGKWNHFILEDGIPYWKRFYPAFTPGIITRNYIDFNFSFEGNYLFQYYAVDGCENYGVGSIELMIDKTPPKITYTGNTVWNTQRIFNRVTDKNDYANEVSGVDKTLWYYVKDNKKVLIADKGSGEYFDIFPMSQFFNAAGRNEKQDGVHGMLLESIDRAGNKTSESIPIYLDESPPRYEVYAKGGKGVEGWNPSKLTFRLQDETSGIRYYKIEEERGGSNITHESKGKMGTSGEAMKYGEANMGKKVDVSISLSNYESGSSFFVREIDEAGNETYGEYKPKWDEEKAECQMECFGETNGWNPQYVTLTYRDKDSGLSNVKAVEGKNNGGLLHNKSFNVTQAPVKSHVETIQTAHYDESLISIEWSATDQVGNRNEGVFPIKIDKTAPTGDVEYNKDTQMVTIDNIIEERSGVDMAWMEIYKESNTNHRQTIRLHEVSPTKWEGIAEPEEEYMREKSFVDVRIADKAGNEALLQRLELDIFVVAAKIHRSLSPDVENSVFKTGEQGYLAIETYGFVDKVEIQFSPLLSQYDRDLEGIEYLLTPRRQEEMKHYFYVPLYVPEGDYSIQVLGYKGGRSKAVPLTLPVKDTILDSIRTRIRG